MLVWAISAQLLDASTFMLAYSRFGMTGELVPFPVAFYEWAGIWGVIGMKLLGIAAMAFIIMWTGRKYPRMAQGMAWAVAIVGAVGAIINTTAWIW